MYGRRAETGSVLTAPGNARKARQYFEQAVELDPNNREAAANLFEYYLDAPGFLGGGIDKAENLAKRIATLDMPAGHHALAQLERKRKRYDAAEQQLRRAAELAPHQVGRLIDLAKFLADRGRVKESDREFRGSRPPGAQQPGTAIRPRRDVHPAEAQPERRPPAPGALPGQPADAGRSAARRRPRPAQPSRELMFHVEALRSSVQALRANKFRAFLTALGLVIGNASVILVVTISLTSRDYVLDQIQAIGSNMIYAQFDGGNNPAMAVADADYIKTSDVQAVRDQLGSRIVAATGVMNNFDQMRIDGRDQDVSIIGADQYYPQVRNLALLAGRFVDAGDIDSRNHVAMLTEQLAKRLFHGQSQAVGQTIKIHGLQFDIIGTFKERTSSFGQSEITGENVMIPITVLKYFAPLERIDPLYVQAHSTADVDTLTQLVRSIIEARHRRRRPLQGRESFGDPERRAQYRRDHDGGAHPGQRDRVDHLGHRHHEHHAGDGDGADARNRPAHGGGRSAARRAGAVSLRSGADQPGRRPGRRRAGRRDSAGSETTSWTTSPSPSRGFRSWWRWSYRCWWAWCSACCPPIAPPG